MYYSDKPIYSKAEDQLDRNHFAVLLANTLLNLKNKDTFSVGLFGKWGSGKTSIVNMALREIERQQKTQSEVESMIVVHFEPWNFSSTDQLLNQFFVRLSGEFQSKRDKHLNNIGKALEKYSDAFELLNTVPKVGGLLSYIGKSGTQKLGNKLQRNSGNSDILKQKEYVIQLLQEQSNKILVVVDDIDRLSNEQIRQIFQLVTSVAKFPNTIYLLVFDKDIVVKALEKVQEGSGEDYLEKVIQMPIQIPEVKPASLGKVLINQLNSILCEYEEIMVQQDQWDELYHFCIVPLIDSLRTINRLCNSVQFKLTSIYTEINVADMVAISLLEIQYPEIYEWVKTSQSVLTGKNDFLLNGKLNTTKEDQKSFYMSQIQILLQAKGYTDIDEHVSKVITFLSTLFPYFGHKIGESYEVYNPGEFMKNNRIAHPDKFERYFSLNLDDIAIKKHEVYDAAFVVDTAALVRILMRQEKEGNSYEFLEEIGAAATDIPISRAKVIIEALLTAAPHFDTKPGVLSVSASHLADFIVIDLLDIIDPADRFAFICDIISVGDLDMLQTLASIINMIELGYGRLAAKGEEQNYKKVITLEELMEIEKKFAEKIQIVLEEHSLFEFDEWRMICYLMECFAPDYMESYLNTALKDDLNIIYYLTDSVSVWIGGGAEYEINDSYKKYLSEEQVLKAIESVKRSGKLFSLPEDVQYKCGAFYIKSAAKGDDRHKFIYQTSVNKLLASWKN